MAEATLLAARPDSPDVMLRQRRNLWAMKAKDFFILPLAALLAASTAAINRHPRQPPRRHLGISTTAVQPPIYLHCKHSRV
ncbi:MAG: hypothetical protein AB1591_08045 [Pseudomonadota bacterium]